MTRFEIILNITVPTLTALSFVTQFFKTRKTNNVSSINPYTQMFTIFASSSWMVFAGGSGVFGSAFDELFIFPFVFYTFFYSMKSNNFSKTKISLFSFITIGWISLTTLFFTLCMLGVISNPLILSWSALIGILFGGTIICFSFIPQLMQTIKTKDVAALSFRSYVYYSLGQIGWTALFISLSITTDPYSSLETFTNVWSIITGAIPLFVQFTLLFYILKYRESPLFKSIET